MYRFWANATFDNPPVSEHDIHACVGTWRLHPCLQIFDRWQCDKGTSVKFHEGEKLFAEKSKLKEGCHKSSKASSCKLSKFFKELLTLLSPVNYFHRWKLLKQEGEKEESDNCFSFIVQTNIWSTVPISCLLKICCIIMWATCPVWCLINI